MKGKRTDLGEANCGIARALQIIGDWWSLLIIRDAFKGSQRFSEFQRGLGLAKNILSSRLKKLVDEGIFVIQPDPHSTLSHRYVLTAKGERLHIVLIALWQWGEEFCFEPGELDIELVDKLKGQPIARLTPLSQQGINIGPGDFRLGLKPQQAGTNRPKGRDL
jgi:DNA-binding HxlR family transcriptional regulator